jgi:hypothetical protein
MYPTNFACDQYFKYIDPLGNITRIDTIRFSFTKTHDEMDSWINNHTYTVYENGYTIKSTWSCGEVVCIY